MSILEKHASRMKHVMAKNVEAGSNVWDWAANEFRHVAKTVRVRDEGTWNGEFGTWVTPASDSVTFTFDNGDIEVVEASDIVMVEYYFPKDAPWQS